MTETLTIEQIQEMRATLKANKKVMTKLTLKKYHNSEKGKIARKKASKKYFAKKRREKIEAEIARVKAELEVLNEKINKL